MTVLVLRCEEVVPESLRVALAEFEEQFQYPLGSGASFHISHGEDYLTFFRAMGRATLLVALEARVVLGTLVGIRRGLRRGEERSEGEVTYLCDLKVPPGPRKGRVFLALARAMEAEWRVSGEGPGYGVVMGGSRRVPTGYTGRCCVPPFTPCGEIMIYRVGAKQGAVREGGDENSEVRETTLEDVRQQFARFTADGWVPGGGEPSERSEIIPVPLVAGDPPVASGLFEDTRRGKRLLVAQGEELLSAHLSHFAWLAGEEEAAAELIRLALQRAITMGFPALFVSVPMSRAASLRPHLKGLEVTEAPATVFAHGVEASGEWWVHTSEI